MSFDFNFVFHNGRVVETHALITQFWNLRFEYRSLGVDEDPRSLCDRGTLHSYACIIVRHLGHVTTQLFTSRAGDRDLQELGVRLQLFWQESI